MTQETFTLISCPTVSHNWPPSDVDIRMICAHGCINDSYFHLTRSLPACAREGVVASAGVSTCDGREKCTWSQLAPVDPSTTGVAVLRVHGISNSEHIGGKLGFKKKKLDLVDCRQVTMSSIS